MIEDKAEQSSANYTFLGKKEKMYNKRGLVEVIAVIGTIMIVFFALILVIFINRPQVYQNSQEISAGQISDKQEKFVTVKQQELSNGIGYCVDSDDSFGDINSQSFISGLVLYLYNACGEDISLLSGNGNPQCSFVLSASDVCKNENTLIEQTCTDSGLKTSEVNCQFGCLSGVCLEQKIDLAFCGDGLLNAGEQCDDGNTLDGDGCNALCIFEPVQPAQSGEPNQGGNGTLANALSAINKWKSGEGTLKEALNAVKKWQA